MKDKQKIIKLKRWGYAVIFDSFLSRQQIENSIDHELDEFLKFVSKNEEGIKYVLEMDKNQIERFLHELFQEKSKDKIKEPKNPKESQMPVFPMD